jgi:hypothetical protein
MARSHRTLHGTWSACDAEACPLPFHVELSVAEAEALPEHVFEALAEAIDPPTYHLPNGTKSWHDPKGNPHREYDLPAIIYGEGSREWYQHGRMSRGRGRPTRVEPNGYKEWWRDEHMIRSQQPGEEPMEWR